ncbi:MAG: cytochrome C oxidase subunit IV family protein [Nitrospinae bacterium]|nr:cytochrome C oxidase subunit IV family protein [Nitrospinota bacterium]
MVGAYGTSFLIAAIKVLMVAAWFMHLNHEPKYVWALLILAFAVIVIMFGGLYPDILNDAGLNWSRSG